MALIFLRVTQPLLSSGGFSGSPILDLRKYATVCISIACSTNLNED
jgi:hypothetical protein